MLVLGVALEHSLSLSRLLLHRWKDKYGGRAENEQSSKFLEKIGRGRKFCGPILYRKEFFQSSERRS